MIKHPLDKSETCSIPSIQNIPSQHPNPELFNINTSDLSAHEHSFSISSPSPPTYSLHRSKSLTDNKDETEISSSRSFSLPSMQDNIMLKYQSPTTKSIDYIDDNFSMPMIVNVEENVEINKQKVRSKMIFKVKFIEYLYRLSKEEVRHFLDKQKDVVLLVETIIL